MAILQATMSANQEYVFITDSPQKLTYTLIIKNDSKDFAKNIVVTDILPNGVAFIPNSFSLNGVNLPEANLNSGVNIGNLSGGKMAVVTFDIEICHQCPPYQINNFATITYTKSSFTEETTESFTTNIVSTKVASLCVNLTKSVDKCSANKNDILNYSILIENNSNITIENINVLDILSPALSLIPQSIFLNGSKIFGDISQGINIGSLDAGCLAMLVFQARVDCIPCSFKIENCASIKFDYGIDLKDAVVTASGCQKSNPVCTSIGPNSFKQFMISSKLPIPCAECGVCEIVNKFIDVDITNTEVIDTIKGLSCEGETLTGKKLVVNGTLLERIEYTEFCEDKSIRVAEYNIHFNTFIVLPENCSNLDCMKVESCIEDVDMRLIDPMTLYQSVGLLLEVIF